MALILLLAAVAIGVATGSSRLDVVDLPIGFFPEGITLAHGWEVYVGSLLEGGSIWKGDLSTGEGEVVLSEAGGPALGLDYDRRSGYLFVAGSSAGTARVYDTNTADFHLVANITLVGSGAGFVNDVIVTDTAAYFTDSLLPQLYSVPLNRESGRPADGTETMAETIPLSSDFTFLEGTINANGIEVTDDGKTLIVVNMSSGELFAVDPATGKASLIDLGGVLVHGDGLVLRKNTLWVVENTFIGSTMQISEVALSADLSCGAVVRTLSNDAFNEPSTAVRKGNSIYAVMFKYSAEDVENTQYEIVRVDRDGDAKNVCKAS